MHQTTRLTAPTHPMVTVAVEERGGRTYARAELQWGSRHLTGLGVAYRHPSDCLTREAGQDLAAARALTDLAERVTARHSVEA